MYSARFAIQHLRYRPIPRQYKDLDQGISMAKRSASMACGVFIEDVKTFVKVALNAELNRLAISEDQDDETMQHSEKRRKLLKQWLKSSYPLDYQPANRLLPTIIASDSHQALVGLPLSQVMKISIMECVQKMYDLCKPGSRVVNVAPLVPGGRFPSVLQIAIEYMSRISPATADANCEAWVKYYLKEVLVEQHIRYVPWHQDPHADQGRQPKKAVWNKWMNLGAPDTAASLLPPSTDDPEVHLANPSQSDPNVPWFLSAITLSELTLYLDREVKPMEWKRPLQGTEYVTATIHWAYEKFDMKNPAHKLALVCAAIFMRILPNVGFHTERLEQRPVTRDRATTTKYIQESAWSYPGHKNGLTDMRPFVGMVVTAILGYMYPQSPLRRRMAQFKNGVGQAWTKKFGKPSHAQCPSCKVDGIFYITGSKGING